MKYSVICQIGQ